MSVGSCVGQFVELLEKLKEPQLVSAFQRFFGVYPFHGKPCCPSNVSPTPRVKGDAEAPRNGFLRHRCDCSSSDEPPTDADSEGEPNLCQPQPYRIENVFWYYLFCFGASLGYEMFYAAFFPVWFWNIDGAVGRRVVFLWVLVMYVGQALKDIIRWPRPGAPHVVQLEPNYTMEYGMPSTHAMVGVVVPFTVLIFTMHRYEYPFIIGLILSVAWCTLVCCSRLYTGMHTVLDIIGGLVLVTILMAVMVPVLDAIDHFLLVNLYSPVVLVGISVILLRIYPSSDHWTPARGDTAVIVGTGVGILAECSFSSQHVVLPIFAVERRS